MDALLKPKLKIIGVDSGLKWDNIEELENAIMERNCLPVTAKLKVLHIHNSKNWKYKNII